MKLSLDLVFKSDPAWAQCVVENFDEFLQDHADAERKASAMAMQFISKAPEKVEIIPQLIETALEELEHFQQVYALMQKRGVQLKKEIQKDHYVLELLKGCRHTPEERLMDRMMVASVVECRGAERFRLVEEALEDPELKRFYKMLWVSEAKHGHVFVDMALKYFPKEEVYERLEFFNQLEGEVMRKMPIRPTLH